MAEVTDEAWADVARASRDALALLGCPIGTRCLPGEPEHCGGTFAQHAAAHLAALEAVAEHQFMHLGPRWNAMIAQIYGTALAELEGGCPDHA